MRTLAILLLVGIMPFAVFSADDEFRVHTTNTSIGRPRAEKDFPIVDTSEYKGAIVPAEEAAQNPHLAKNYKDFWTPTTNDIAKAETRLTTFIDNSNSRHAAGIRRKLKWFRRQYVGYTADGEKRILCSFLPGVGEGEDPFVRLRRSFIKVYDGGSDYWQIHYRVEKDSCERLYVDLGF